MRTNTHLTLYNIYYNPSTKADTYFRTVIKDIAWENRKAINVLASGGNQAVDKAIIYIPMLRGDDYIWPKAWQILADKTAKWTLQEGDLLVKGSVSDELSSVFLPTALAAKYDDMLVITSIDEMDLSSRSLQHWEIGAK